MKVRSIGRGTISLLFIAVLLASGARARAQSADTTPPTEPGTPSASITAYNTVQISWGASTDDVGVVGYYVYRDGGSVGNTPNTSFTDVAPPGAYSYTVAAYDAAGNISRQSDPSGIVSVVQDTTPPTPPTGLMASVTTSSIALSWNASTDNVGVVGYYIAKNGNRLTLSTTGPYTGTSYTDSGLQPATLYRYTVTAYDAAGNISGSASITTSTLPQYFNAPDTTPPSVPAFLVATPVSTTEVDLRWQASTDNEGVAGYYVYRNGGQVASTASSTVNYNDSGLSNDTTYSYTVAAYDAAGNVSGQSAVVNATTFLPDATPPSAPTDINGTAVSVSSILLHWNASYDNVGVTAYDVYRNGTSIASVTSTSYLDTGLASGTTYSYIVTAYDAAGNVSPQAFGTASTPATNPVIPAVSSTTTPRATPTPTVGTFTTTLFYGMRSTLVTSLQNILIKGGYLGPNYATGFYGSLTQQAVEKFQCAQAIVCSGGPTTSGWGTVGPKTRKALNTL